MELDQLAPGVLGYTIEADGALYVPVIVAEQEGNGDVGRYPDSLPRDRTIRFPNVISAKLREMLIRRGFNFVTEWAAEYGEVGIWERKAEREDANETRAVSG